MTKGHPLLPGVSVGRKPKRVRLRAEERDTEGKRKERKTRERKIEISNSKEITPLLSAF